MKAFSNANPKDIREAVSMLSQAHSQGRTASIVGGGSDLLGMVKEHLVAPDVLVNLKAIRGLDQIETQRGKVKIGGLITLDSLEPRSSAFASNIRCWRRPPRTWARRKFATPELSQATFASAPGAGIFATVFRA